MTLLSGFAALPALHRDQNQEIPVSDSHPIQLGDLFKPVLKRRVWLPNVPLNSAEPLGFCREALQNVSHSKSLLKKGIAELWEPSPAFQALQILLP